MLIQKHVDLIDKFYAAFSDGNADKMISCYHKDAEFNDPAFGDLDYDQVCAMWRMLLERSDDLKISYKNAWSENDFGGVDWEAKYTFSKTGRLVHNVIDAKFQFKEGLIIGHRDYFDFHRWSSMALGTPGKLLGWTEYLRKKVKNQCSDLLDKYMNQ